MVRSPAPTLIVIVTRGDPHAGQAGFDITGFEITGFDMGVLSTRRPESFGREVGHLSHLTQIFSLFVRFSPSLSGLHSNEKGDDCCEIEPDMGPDRRAQAAGSVHHRCGHDSKRKEAGQLDGLKV